MPLARPAKSDAGLGFAFINVAHPDEIRQKSTQKTIRSGAMAAIGRARRKRPEKPVVVELSLPQREGTDSEAGDGFRAGVLTTVCRSTALSDFQKVPPAMPHLGIFAVEPDKRARELFHFSM